VASADFGVLNFKRASRRFSSASSVGGLCGELDICCSSSSCSSLGSSSGILHWYSIGLGCSIFSMSNWPSSMYECVL